VFTGLIREFGYVTSLENNFLDIKAKHKPNIGDSIAVNGACLTVVKVLESSFVVELSPETQNLVAVENLKNKVHIEPAMKLSERLEGHILQGHIDTTGTIQKIQQNQNSTDFFIKIPSEFIKYVIPKGSIAIDGVSLTVNDVFSDSFRLTIIPYTIEQTLFATYQIGQKVNVETDMFSKYIYNMFKKDKQLSWTEVDGIMARF
jgi:riboflavin synthase